MKNVEEQKKKLEQKKNRLSIEETKLRLKERKARTRHLIENGGLITKAGLDHLPANALYGALLSLKEQINGNDQIIAAWIVKGDKAFNAEKRTSIPVICKFNSEPIKEIRDSIRSLGLRWNRFRQEWYGNIQNIGALKKTIEDTKYELEILEDNTN